MDLLNFFDFENRPVLKFIVIALVIINAFALAVLIFGPRFFPSMESENGAGTSASPGYEVGWSDYSGTALEALKREDDEDSEDAADTADTSSTDHAAEEEEEGEMPESGPLLELVDDHVTLKVGDYFNFYSYIKTMRDRDGRELSRYIHLTGSVNTNVPGDYLITYRITSQVDGVSASADLLVTVEEDED